MNKYILSASLLIIAAILITVRLYYSEDGLDDQALHGMMQNGDPKKCDDAEVTEQAQSRLSRPTLEESLPPGSKLLAPSDERNGVSVVLADGKRIDAAGASVSESGISFKGPFKLTNPVGMEISSAQDESVCLLSRDGETIKMIPLPGGSIRTTFPPKKRN